MEDSILLAQQVDHLERQAEQERQRAQGAESRLARAIRHLHGLGQEVDAIAAALAVDPERVREALSE